MTIEEAIKWMQEEKASLERAPDLNGCPMTECWQKAIDVYDMAISALRKQDVTDKNVGKMTNADRIRAMSDDELNGLFHEIYNAGAEDAVAYEWGQRTNSFEWTMEWLQQPAEEDKHENLD